MTSNEDGFSKTTATLRICGEDLKPEEITRLVGTEPTGAWEKGAPGYKGSPRPQGMWMLESSVVQSASMEAHLAELLSKTSSSKEIWQDLCSRFECDLFVGAWMDSDNAVFSLPPRLLEQIGQRGLMLVADLYFVGEEGEI